MNMSLGILNACIEICDKKLMKQNIGSPREADIEDLWAHLKIRYRDGDKLVEEKGLIWDVWKKGDGYALYCFELKEAIEVPRPKKLGGD